MKLPAFKALPLLKRREEVLLVALIRKIAAKKATAYFYQNEMPSHIGAFVSGGARPALYSK
jgi:hypothetical protein